MNIHEIVDKAPTSKVYDFRSTKDWSSITYVVLTRTGHAILFHDNNNTLPFRRLATLCWRYMDKNIQDDIFAICVKENGYLVRRSRSTKDFLHGDRNRYSKDINGLAKALMDRQLADEHTSIWLGDPKQAEGERIGSIKAVLMRKFPPTQLLLYHGTSSRRLTAIKEKGLVPLPMKYRVWNDETDEDVTQREDSIYLTAVLPQAEYYAKTAVETDTTRYGSAEIKPVILQVVIGQSEYGQLQPDDDFVVDDDVSGPKTWLHSLSYYGQVAFQGKIPPSNLSIIEFGKDAEQHSQ